MTKKLMLLGIDGFDWNTLIEIINNNENSNFKYLMNSSNFGFLKVPLPPRSPAVWITIATGQTRIEHGVLDFINVSKTNNIGYEMRVHSSTSLRGKAIWDKLSKKGYKSIIVNYPFTYPPYKINGILISGFPIPHDNIVGYPEDIAKKLNEKFPNYRNELVIEMKSESEKEIDKIINMTIHSILTRFKLWYHLIKNNEFDFTSLVFTETDRIQHIIYGHPIYKKKLLKIYDLLDKILGKILKICEELNMTLILVSDHSFEELKYMVSLPKILEDLGITYYSSFISDYLKRKKIQKIVFTLYKNRFLNSLIEKLNEIGLPDKIDKLMGSFKKSNSENLVIIQNNFTLKLTKPIKEKIKALKKLLENYSYNGIKPFEKVFTKTEYIKYIKQHNKVKGLKKAKIVKGKMEKLPDIILITKPTFEPTINKLKEPVIDVKSLKTKMTGTHYSKKSANGVFFLYDPNKREKKFLEISPIEIVPIITNTLNIE